MSHNTDNSEPVSRLFADTAQLLRDSEAFGDESAAPAPARCLGWCSRQGRGNCGPACGRTPTLSRDDVIDSNLAGLDIADAQAERMRIPEQMAVAFTAVLAFAVLLGVAVFVLLDRLVG